MASPSAPAPRPGRAVDTGTPKALAAAAGTTFEALSRARGARIFHPRGIAHAAVLHVGAAHRNYTGVPLLEHPGEHPAVVRFSRGVGLPEPLPDVLGVALRLLDAHGSSRHQDFLLATSGHPPLLRHLLLPGVGWFGQDFSSLLLYRVGGRIRVVGARAASPVPAEGRGMPGLEAAAAGGSLRFRLTLASPGGRWEVIGELVVGARLPDEETEALAFTPWHSGGGILPVGPLMGVRRAAYRGSQRGRGLGDRQIP